MDNSIKNLKSTGRHLKSYLKYKKQKLDLPATANYESRNFESSKAELSAVLTASTKIWIKLL